MAIGSAFATGAAALGTFLVLGFTLHNITEGIGIVAPLVEERPRLPVFAALAALAGLPAVAGIWLGSYAFAPHWAALALAVGAGAILQVIIEVGLLLARRSARSEGRGMASAAATGGVAGRGRHVRDRASRAGLAGRGLGYCGLRHASDRSSCSSTASPMPEVETLASPGWAMSAVR